MRTAQATMEGRNMSDDVLELDEHSHDALEFLLLLLRLPEPTRDRIVITSHDDVKSALDKQLVDATPP